MKYEAFISYRHGDIDEKVAVQVHREIEKYRVPGKLAKKLGKKRVGRVFRDSDELRASSDLSAVIRDALDESEWLIVIVTERYSDSPWCMEEIEYFVRLRGRERVLVILASGEPNEVFPKALTEIVGEDGQTQHIEPLAVDIRGESEHAVIKNLKQERFRFFSSMLGVAYDDLRNRQRERRRRRMVAVLGSVFVILAGVIGVVTVKNIQLNEAYDALDKSNQDTLRGESYYLAEYADQAYAEGDRQTAMKLALKALPKDLKNPDRPYVADAIRSLTKSTGIYDLTAGYHAAFVVNREDETYDARTQVSKDGSLVLIETYEESRDMMKREIRVVRVSDGLELCRYEGEPIPFNVFVSDTSGAALSDDGKRLYYLGKNGLTCVEIESGREIFTADKAVDMRFHPTAASGHTALVTINYAEGRLYGYDLEGKQTLNVEIGSDMNYELGQMDSDGRLMALAANTETQYGVITVDLETGEASTYAMEGACRDVRFSGKNRLCFLMSDTQEGLRHIVQYETETGEQRYLCDTALYINEVELTDRATCYYYLDNTIYEVDCNSKKGKVLWEYPLNSQITAIKAQDGLVAVSCKDGSVSVFDEDKKTPIRTPDSSGTAVFVTSISKQVLLVRNYWGQSVRVYVRKGPEVYPDVMQTSLREVTGGLTPDQWFGGLTNCGRFLFGGSQGDENWISVFDAGSLEKICDKSYRELDLDGDNKSFFFYGGQNSVNLLDYDYYMLHLYRADDLKEIYQASMENSVYSDKDTEMLYETKDGKMRVIDGKTGNAKKEMDVPDGFDGGFCLGERMIYTVEGKVRIDGPDGKTETILDDVTLEDYNETRQLLICRKSSGESWYAYDVQNKKVLCEDKSGNNHAAHFFGENRYILIDYSKVYDMDTWQIILELKAEDGNVYGVQTTETLPYLVVWCRKDAANDSDLNIAALYEKDGSGELVGEVPNYVTLAPDGQIITYDGEQTLYKFPLLSVEQVKERAEQLVGDTAFSERQKERYHLFG